MTSTVPPESIHLDVLDSVLYGAAKAFDYLGLRGQEMLDTIGEGIIDYGIKKRFFKRSDDYSQFANEIVTFFRNNKYVDHVGFSQDGQVISITMGGWNFIPLMTRLRNENCFLVACPLCLASNSVLRENSLGWKEINEKVNADGTYAFQVRVVPYSNASRVPPEPANLGACKNENPVEWIGLPVFEATEYGLARGFDYLGAQAQVFLDDVGQGAVEFLKSERHMQLSENHRTALQELSAFYTQGGLADRIDFDTSNSKLEVSFTNYRYAPVLEQLINEGCRLTSCPFTLAARAVLRKAGYAVTNMHWKTLSDHNATMMMDLRFRGQEFDEDKVGEIMDQV